MTEEVKPNFLKSVEFLDDTFYPFKSGKTIIFGGEKEGQRMIEFYLKNQNNLPENTDKKTDEEISKNAKRFKINCILGNNGGGKSRLFRGIKGYLLTNIIIDNIHDNKILLDDLSSANQDNKYDTVNYNIDSYNGVLEFLLEIYLFLQIDNKLNNIFSYFLNEKINHNGLLEHNLSFETKFSNYGFANSAYSDDVISGFFLELHPNNVSPYEFESFCKTIITTTKNLEIDYCDISNIYKLINKDGNFINIFIISSGILGFLLELLLTIYTEETKKKRFYFEKSILDFYDNSDISDIKAVYNNIVKNLGNKSALKSDMTDLKNILQKFFFSLSKSSFLLHEGITLNNIEKKFLLNSPLSANLHFKNRSFLNLSSGEKMMLIRFTNIYMSIVKYNLYEEKKENSFIILIDEPDLHLHLDWQRQYIQKLIDVFSTLDPEISLHFIIATHSPFIISDLPKESLVLLNKGEQVPNKEIPETFGANYIDIIKNGFFFKKEQMLMGSFAQNIIGNIAENERKQFCSDEGKTFSNLIENNIGDEFLKDNLLYFKPEKND